MKNVFALVLGLLLTVSLALYGSTGMANVGPNVVFSMEICADGVAKTVSFDANGNPVEQTQTCSKCLTCCLALEVLPPGMWSLVPSLNRLDMEAVNPVAPNPIKNKRNLYPAPRGPPDEQFPMPSLITFDWSASRRMLRSDGRPIPKDAAA
ncbi:hypothetical protein PhaeoP97_03837 (plasmid) [Phaeobacter porticola]|uniref:DUF2946 domain-containing protein n=1 Tax=Phaeobacter porticola TaxID=1844006 RepID=A0A1L3IAM9_9RHOB|nr:hypothetical protein PhaeoP97_03837 [Phaeobacter porticola]